MMIDKLIAILLCCSLSSLSLAQGREQKPATQTTQPVQNVQGLPAPKVREIELLISAWIRQHKAPALSVAIVTDNKMSFSEGYGLADVENNVSARSDTAYRLASIAKSLTAVAVMQLVERGKLDLDAPINKYCTAYPEKQSLKDAPDKQLSITARQLLVHQSGVRHNKVPDEIISTRQYASIDEAIGSFAGDALVVEPETKYSYSTPGYTLLGCATEGASGVSYIDYVRENIFKPAGMTRTFIDDVYAIIPNRARGYRKTEKGEIQNAPLHDTSIKIPGGGLVTTAEDLAKFTIAVNNNQLVKPETLAQMWSKPKTRDGKEQSYAFGFLVGADKGQRKIFNDGSQAGTRTYLFMLPEKGFAVALMTNLERASCEELAPKIADVVFDVVPRVNPNVSSNLYEALVGQYQLTPNLILTVTKEDNRLMGQATGQPKVELFPETETKFFMRVVDARIAFAKNEQGQVTGLIFKQGGREAQANKIK